MISVIFSAAAVDSFLLSLQFPVLVTIWHAFCHEMRI